MAPYLKHMDAGVRVAATRATVRLVQQEPEDISQGVCLLTCGAMHWLSLGMLASDLSQRVLRTARVARNGDMESIQVLQRLVHKDSDISSLPVMHT